MLLDTRAPSFDTRHLKNGFMNGWFFTSRLPQLPISHWKPNITNPGNPENQIAQLNQG